jgi:hypothetical protein
VQEITTGNSLRSIDKGAMSFAIAQLNNADAPNIKNTGTSPAHKYPVHERLRF